MPTHDRSGYSSYRRRTVLLGLGGCGLLALAGGGKSLLAAPVAGRDIGRLYADANVGIRRSGRALDYAPGMWVASGDIIRTDGVNRAVVDYADGNRVVIYTHTQIRLGSVFVEFGRMFALVRDFFRADSDVLTAAPERTEFMMEVGLATPGTTVTVRRGAVLCIPRFARWMPIRLRENEWLRADRRSRFGPRTSRQSPQETAAATRWADDTLERLLPRSDAR